ncbi:MAG: hypothetical protein ABIC96_04420 [Patescibacteria group bacterium]
MAEGESKKYFSVIIRNRERILIQEEVKSLSSINEKGPFDILGEHENFISIIKEHLIIEKKDGTKQEIKFDNGIVKVYANEVQVYIGILSHPQVIKEATKS